MGNLDTGAAGFAQGFIDAWQRKQDRDDRLKETSEDRALRKAMFQMQAAQQGYDVGSDLSLSRNPEYERKQELEQKFNAKKSGLMGVQDESGKISDYQYDPSSPEMIKANHTDVEDASGLVKAGFLPKKGSNGLLDPYASTGVNKPALEFKKDMKIEGSPYASTLNQRQAFQAHQRNIQALKKDPVLTKRLNQYQNLDNALSIITHADVVTPQQFAEFQQAVRSNMGISGTGGVGEREETYFKSAGLNAAAWKQFLTGDPVALSKDSHAMEHFRNLAKVEQNNIKKQYTSRIKAVTGGNASVYREHPELQEDLDDLISSFGDQVEQPGLMPPTAQGMMKMTKVRDVDGSIKQIPVEDLQEALADGAVEVP